MNLYRELKDGEAYVNVATSGNWKHTTGDANPDVENWEDVTNVDNWIYYAERHNKDYVWLQRRVGDFFEAKAGATNTLKWGNCSNEERDLIIYYNQMKSSIEATESTDKVVHLMTTGQAADASEGAAFLKKTHAQSIGRAKPAIADRVDSDKLVEVIITYLNRVDTNQLLNTVKTHLANYKSFAMVGTIIYGEEEALRDYLESTGPTYFENGLVEESWTTENAPATLTDLKDELINILFGDNE